MAERYLKPQSPIQDGADYILPMTSYDQIIMPDGESRWDGVSGSETKSISDIDGLEEALASAGKVKTVNEKEPDENGNIKIVASDVGARPDDWTPSISDIEGLQETVEHAGKLKTINGRAPDEEGNIDLTWETIPNKPETFDPIDHGHAWNEITDKPSAYTPSSHGHTWTEITNKPSTYPPSTHTHAAGDVGAKPSSYVPAWSEITGKPSSYTPATHTHEISDVTNLSSRIVPTGGSSGQVLTKTSSGMQWANVQSYGLNLHSISGSTVVDENTHHLYNIPSDLISYAQIVSIAGHTEGMFIPLGISVNASERSVSFAVYDALVGKILTYSINVVVFYVTE